MANWQEIDCLLLNQLALQQFSISKQSSDNPCSIPTNRRERKKNSANRSNFFQPDKSCHAVIGGEGLFHCLHPSLSGGADYGDFHAYKDLSGTFQYGNRYSFPFPELNIVCMDEQQVPYTTGTSIKNA